MKIFLCWKFQWKIPYTGNFNKKIFYTGYRFFSIHKLLIKMSLLYKFFCERNIYENVPSLHKICSFFTGNLNKKFSIQEICFSIKKLLKKISLYKKVVYTFFYQRNLFTKMFLHTGNLFFLYRNCSIQEYKGFFYKKIFSCLFLNVMQISEIVKTN